jgi:uncharacterized protein
MSVPNTETRVDPGRVHETQRVLFKNSPIHGLGGFARVGIPSGTAALEYVGEKISKAESLKRCEADNVFIFALSEQEDIDGNVPWNPARWLNHSCSPNAEAQVIEGRIWLIAIRDIAPEEEITFNYGFDLENYQEYPCGCGAPNCVGFMVAEEFFDHVRGRNALRLDRAKAS